MTKDVNLVLPQTKSYILPTHTHNEETTFLAKLSAIPGLDLRDNRGKRHDLVFVLFGFIYALLTGNDGNMSAVHRAMKNKNSEICACLGIENQLVVSRSQLPVILCKVDVRILSEIVFCGWGVRIDVKARGWFALDGKELRGSILKGNRRGLAMVQAVSHLTGLSVGLTFYSGDKESEKPCFAQICEENELYGEQLTADALHLSQENTEQINRADGIYVFGLKKNQKLLYQDMEEHVAHYAAVEEQEEVERGHGRVEHRIYRAYDMEGDYSDERWDKSDLRTLVSVERIRKGLKGNRLTHDTSFYLSNQKAERSKELFGAIRGHWRVETNHHYRDVTLKEDKLRTKFNAISKVAAVCRTVVLAILKPNKNFNSAARIQEFADVPSTLKALLIAANFL